MNEWDLDAGQEEYEETEEKMNMQKSVKKIAGSIRGNNGFSVATVIALCTMMGVKAEETNHDTASDVWLDLDGVWYNSAECNWSLESGYGTLGCNETAHAINEYSKGAETRTRKSSR